MTTLVEKTKVAWRFCLKEKLQICALSAPECKRDKERPWFLTHFIQRLGWQSLVCEWIVLFGSVCVCVYIPGPRAAFFLSRKLFFQRSVKRPIPIFLLAKTSLKQLRPGISNPQKTPKLETNSPEKGKTPPLAENKIKYMFGGERIANLYACCACFHFSVGFL